VDSLYTITVVVPLVARLRHNRVVPTNGRPRLGHLLREVREARDWSLRDVAGRAGINHGYLSQLERGDIAEPGPSMLHKVAKGYDIPFSVVMEWSGYIEPAGKELTPNQALALSYLGENPSDEDLAAVRAVLDAIRSRSATFGGEAASLDVHLDAADRATIRAEVLALLRRSDALGIIPTPLEHVLEVAGLVATGEISLDEQEKRKLRTIFGSLVDAVLDRLQGVIHLRAREIWIQPDLHALKRRFVTAHEIGHDLLPAHRERVYLDDHRRLRPEVRLAFEREANHAAVEMLAQGDTLRREADDSHLTVTRLSELSSKYQISLQAITRYVVEQTRRQAALTLRFRGRTGNIGPPHVYSSSTFESQFGWASAGMLPPCAARAGAEARSTGAITTFQANDLSLVLVEMAVEVVDTPHALIAIYTPTATRTLVKRLLFVRSAQTPAVRLASSASKT
jgi:transcriptional regulator with XRE-family HTH domain